MTRRIGSVLCLLAGAGLAGCGGDEQPEVRQEQPRKQQPEPVVSVQTAEQPPLAPPLKLRLQPGQQFPVRKTVEQTLTQQSGAEPAVGRTRLELWLLVSVEEIASDGHQRLRIDYQRVRYVHDVPGEWFEFDSANRGAPVPLIALPYRGMVGSGFSLWINHENRIDEVVGFREFLANCVRDVPVDRRLAVLAQFEHLADAAEIANIIDDGIGLLPDAGSEEPKIGQTWTRERRLGRALPLHVTSRCTLTDLTAQAAQISLAGHFAPTAAIKPVGAGGEAERAGLRVWVRGGHSSGHCTIDRQTGLPLRSVIERHVEMLVEPPAAPSFVQHKHLLTTIETFPETPEPRTALLRHADRGAH
jgi:hypothetical protein